MDVARCVSACIAVLLLLSTAAATPVGLRVLLMGLVDRNMNPLSDWLSLEPGTVYSVVPTRLYKGSWADTHGEAFHDEIRRFIRIYFPRTYGDIIGYDVILLSSILIAMYEPGQVEWLTRSIEEGGVCGIADTGGMMGKSPDMYIPWTDSSLSEAFPCDADATAAVFKLDSAPNLDYFMMELNPEVPAPVFSPFIPYGIERWRGASGRIMVGAQGATTWGTMHAQRGDFPWVLSWTFGKGTTWSVGDAPRYPFWSRYEVGWSDNDFGMDMWFNMMLFGTGRKPVTNVALVHSVRDSFRLYREQVETTISFLDFVEKFGADTGVLLGEIQSLEPMVLSAMNDYVLQDYEDAMRKMDEVSGLLAEISNDGLRLRDRALFWVHLIEWMVVTSTGIISGFAVFSLMIRRRLHRETKVTRRA